MPGWRVNFYALLALSWSTGSGKDENTGQMSKNLKSYSLTILLKVYKVNLVMMIPFWEIMTSDFQLDDFFCFLNFRVCLGGKKKKFSWILIFWCLKPRRGRRIFFFFLKTKLRENITKENIDLYFPSNEVRKIKILGKVEKLAGARVSVRGSRWDWSRGILRHQCWGQHDSAWDGCFCCWHARQQGASGSSPLASWSRTPCLSSLQRQWRGNDVGLLSPKIV